MGKLENKVAIVTGGAQGIGRAIAAGYVAEGAKVVVADIAEETARATAADIGSSGSAIGLPLDVPKQASIDALLDQTLETFDCRTDSIDVCEERRQRIGREGHGWGFGGAPGSRLGRSG
jgi:NAD(P)-dependent dehydrogenase (short-subunit alcohol dehydrogenase family)